MAFKLTIDNPESLTAAIGQLEQVASESVLRQATVAGARVIFEEVKLRAPVGDATWESKGGKQKRYPGFLRDNILLAFDKERSAEGLRATYLVTWSKDAFYGRFLEYGTSKMVARPFLRPAYDAMRDAAAKRFSEVIDEKVRELTSG
ncbi:HK97-gp10 family putative phage morphogenesis protein [Burkholderia vietnamiensis]|uniref:HK97-gp10 family putative phage morphogenesis protein n=1 Tax=Burkholderia vietnamiensis TaxID=60552 RepID=UPI001B925021|nr:HK97-gp10 family putative phage morphogenesis protein [Burkholderia vietnamiensis]MBR8084564.1 HK97 gp10 family phage protein [Burkholderia vietnamiensis]MCA8198350.1 HK97 gp10 family phage protein [Burkholderia vietnamiensis]